MSVRRLAGLGTAVVMLALGAVSAGAQEYNTSIGWGGGYTSYAPFVERGDYTPVEIGLSPTWFIGLQGESWQLDRWVGLRLGGTFSKSKMSLPTADRNISVSNIEAALLLRAFRSASASAYLIGGGGLVSYGLGKGGPVAIAGTSLTYDDHDRRQLSAIAGGGLEIVPGWRAFDGTVGLRFEGVDQVVFGQPFRPIEGPEFDSAHNLRFSVSLFAGVTY